MLGNHWEKLGGVDLRPLSELDTTGMRCAAAWLSPCLPDEWCAGRVAWNAWTGKFSGEPKQAEVPILQEAKGIYIWLHATGSDFRYLHVGLAKRGKSSLWKRTQVHVGNARSGKDFIYDLNRLGPRDQLPKAIEPIDIVAKRASDHPSLETMLQENKLARERALPAYFRSIRVLYLPIDRTSEHAADNGQLAKVIGSIEASIDCAARGYFAGDEAARKDAVVGNQFVQNSPSSTATVRVKDLEAVRQALNRTGLTIFPRG